MWCDFSSAVHRLIDLNVNLTQSPLFLPILIDQSQILWKILLVKQTAYSLGILQRRQATQITLQGNFMDNIKL